MTTAPQAGLGSCSRCLSRRACSRPSWQFPGSPLPTRSPPPTGLEWAHRAHHFPHLSRTELYSKSERASSWLWMVCKSPHSLHRLPHLQSESGRYPCTDMGERREQQDCRHSAPNTASPRERRAPSPFSPAQTLWLTLSTTQLCCCTCGPRPMSLVPTDMASSQEALCALESSPVPCPSEALVLQHLSG